MKQVVVLGAGNWGKNLIRNFYELGALKAVADVFHVSQEDLLSERRPKYITTPRFALMYLGYYMTHNSTTTVGRFLKRDHTTIIHGLRRAIQIKRNNKAFAEKLYQAQELAIAYEKKRRSQLDAFKKEIQERMEDVCQGVEISGVISGDKVVFPSGNTKRQHRVDEVPAGEGKRGAA